MIPFCFIIRVLLVFSGGFSGSCVTLGNIEAFPPRPARTGNNLKLLKKVHTPSQMSKKYKDVHCKLREFFKEASILKRYGTKTKCSVFLKMKQRRQEVEELL